MIKYNSKTKTLTATINGKPVAGMVGKKATKKAEQINNLNLNKVELVQSLNATLNELRLRASNMKIETVADIRELHRLEVKIAHVKTRIHNVNYTGNIMVLPLITIAHRN